jgi:O-antigen/teichoic acid export membrane protein
VQRRDQVDAAASTVFVSMLASGALVGLVSLGLSPLVGLYFHSHEVALVAAALSGYFVLTALLDVPFTLLRRRLVVRPSLLIDPLAVVAFGSISAAGLSEGLGVWALVLGWYAMTLTNIIGYNIAARWKPDLGLVTWSLWRELAGYARHILASELLSQAMTVANTAVVGRAFGRTNLGQFRFAWRLATQGTTPIIAGANYTIQPALVQLADDPRRTKTVVLSALRLLSMLAFPFGALFIPLGEPIALVVFGDKWRYSGQILMALSGLAVAVTIISLASEVLKAHGRPDILPRMQGLWTFLSIGLMIALIPLGAVGMGAGASVAALAAAIYVIARMRAVLNVQPPDVVRAIMPALATSAVMAAFLLVLDRYVLPPHHHESLTTLGLLLTELGLGAAVYLALLAVFARDALKELAQTIALIPGLRRFRTR